MLRNTIIIALLATIGSVHLAQAQGGRIAYETGPRTSSLNHEVIVTDLSGNDRILLEETVGTQVSGFGGLSWAPDGRRLATRLRRSNVWDIYAIDTETGAAVNVTQDSFIDRAPAWSPDGRQIAYVSLHGGPAQIYVIGVDGGTPVQLTDNPSLDETPSWSPDGSQIVFASNRDGDFEIYVMNADGSDQRRLTVSPRDEFYPEWSPDGQHIVFFSDFCARCSTQQSDIMVMRPDGSDLVNLTNSLAQNIAPTWSPDGSQIAFSSNRGGAIDIFTMNADGSQVTNVTHNSPSVMSEHAAWARLPGAPTAVEMISWGRVKIERR